MSAAGLSGEVPSGIAFGRFVYDESRSRLLLDGREVALPQRDLQLLGIFLRWPAVWLGDEDLSRQLWPKAVPPTGELDRLVRRLTSALDAGADGVATIQQSRARGYRWLFPLRDVGANEGQSAAKNPGDPAPAAAPALPGRRSARRTLLSPRRLAAALAIAAAVSGLLFWAARSAERGAQATAATPAKDPATMRAAAAAELAKGVAAASQSDLASRRVAIGRFEAALALDPSGPLRAATHAALAGVLVLEGDFTRADTEARGAIALDSGIAEAHAALAVVQTFRDRDVVAARLSAERALNLDVAQTAGWRALAWVNALEGNFVVALGQLSQVRTANHFDPDLETDESSILYLSGRALEARQRLAEVVRREPAFRRAHAALAELHLTERRLGAAALEFELLDVLRAGATAQDERVRLRTSGTWMPPDASEAARLLEDRATAVHQRNGMGPELEAAWIFAQFGDPDRALAALGRALERRESGAVLARIDPVFAPLRKLPAFRNLLEQAGVPPAVAARPAR
ncbi:MAG: hypothetical protein ABI639_08310 [Thermoanaerobaculia bacterium]